MKKGKIGKTQPDIRSISHQFFRHYNKLYKRKLQKQENENK